MPRCQMLSTQAISIHALLAESDFMLLTSFLSLGEFLSTLSLRRATFGTTRIRRRICNFYPRSPCGERREPTAFRTPHHIFLSTLSLRRATVFAGVLSHDSRISIHALLAESDADKHDQSPRRPRISIHALLAESDARFRYWVLSNAISIHALLAESD